VVRSVAEDPIPLNHRPTRSRKFAVKVPK
jgi:hypothetical protein